MNYFGSPSMIKVCCFPCREKSQQTLEEAQSLTNVSCQRGPKTLLCGGVFTVAGLLRVGCSDQGLQHPLLRPSSALNQKYDVLWRIFTAIYSLKKKQQPKKSRWMWEKVRARQPYKSTGSAWRLCVRMKLKAGSQSIPTPSPSVQGRVWAAPDDSCRIAWAFSTSSVRHLTTARTIMHKKGGAQGRGSGCTNISRGR